MSKHTDYLEELKKVYEPYADFAGNELAQIDVLTAELERSKDPAWLAFRENPVTQKMYVHCIASYKACYNHLASDDGTLTQLERAKLDIGKRWSLWFLKSLGGDPDALKSQVEQEIERLADSAGIVHSI